NYVDFAQANFAIRLLQETAEYGKSTVISPVSISTSLFMIYYGSGGATRQELNNALANGANARHVQFYVAKLLTDIASSKYKNYKLDIANRIYVRPNLPVKLTFHRFIRLFYQEVLHEINYYQRFQIAQVEMMSITAKFPLFYDKNLMLLRLPYIGNEVEMIAILPRNRFNLPNVLRNLTGQSLLYYIYNAREHEVELHLPKFKLNGDYNLKDILEKLNITKIFHADANFSELTFRQIFVNNIVHKSFIEVNEEGTEAAASTRVELEDKILPNIAYFHANQPFLFAIVKDSKTILFAGQFS
ncbi:unnamed protein product, partial [Thelazia callipaeda]|uniref:SERPIN domain-containing protein n=1 Tax=Thelazia callipaeda TaxID=103827 RepID=A0A0N5DBF3_THECL